MPDVAKREFASIDTGGTMASMAANVADAVAGIADGAHTVLVGPAAPITDADGMFAVHFMLITRPASKHGPGFLIVNATPTQAGAAKGKELLSSCRDAIADALRKRFARVHTYDDVDALFAAAARPWPAAATLH